jgi:hypothetical protein
MAIWYHGIGNVIEYAYTIHICSFFPPFVMEWTPSPLLLWPILAYCTNQG